MLAEPDPSDVLGRLLLDRRKAHGVELPHGRLIHDPGLVETLGGLVDGLQKEVEHWSQITLQEKLVKIGAKVVSHGRYVTFQLAEMAIPGRPFAEMLRRIDGLRPRPAPT